LSVLVVENPIKTILRLMENQIQIIKDNGQVALVKVSEVDYDRELIKDFEAQVIVALDSARGVEDQKLCLSGSLRRRVVWLKVVGVALSKENPTADSGQVMRDKLTEQIMAIIRENRNNPFTTTYTFYGLGYPSGYPHVAKDVAGSADLPPTSAPWAELSAADYQKVWSNDDVLHSKSNAAIGGFSLMLFRFKIGAKAQCIKSIVINWVGYGVAPGGYGVAVKVWDIVAGAWGNTQTGTGTSKETLTISLTSGWINYINADGYLYLLAQTANPATAGGSSVLYCDFVQCVFQVKGLTNVDVVSYVTSTVKDVKPYLFKTEFLLRGWLFESIP
jgi:hypothetical protein